jgi:6-pyruvoyltetrahydropterin/6-carboxytetrahydropterin synthase
MYELLVQSEFAAAHYLREYEGKCENLHGHNWKIEMVLRSSKVDRAGMLIDFKHARSILSSVLEAYDHRYLNDVGEFKDVNPTTENISRILYKAIGERLPEGVKVAKVTCWESDHCGSSYFEE